MTLHYDQLARYLHEDELVAHVRALVRESGTPCWLVGGAVRDPLLGRRPKDADFIYCMTSDTVPLPMRLAEALDVTCISYTRDLTVERVMVGAQPFDFVRLEDSGELHGELRRRDFTINALAVPMLSPDLSEASLPATLIDVTDGRIDLEARTIRFIEESAIVADPLRILRAYRFALSLQFALPAESQELALKHRDLLALPSGERIREELLLILGQVGGAATLTALCDAGILGVRFPALEVMRDVPQNGYHHLPVWEHTLECVHQLEAVTQFWPEPIAEFADELGGLIALEFVPGRSRLALMKLALLFHDLGKPGTRAVRPDGVTSFIGHDQLSCELMRPYLEDLHLSGEEIGYVDCLVRQHLRPGFLDLDAPTARRMVHRYFAALPDYGVDLALISIADRLAAQGPLLTEQHNARHWAIVRHLCQVYFREREVVIAPPPLVSGGDLLEALGIEPGPKVGELLREIKEAQAMGEVASREEALSHARSLLEGQSGPV